MKITKLEHACLDITDADERIIIDPGVYAKSLTKLAVINAVVITHVHGDHLDEDLVLKIVEQNPGLQIFTTQQAADKLSKDWHITVPNIGAQYKVESFTLEFFGGMHALIMDNFPQDQNFGVLINDKLYYPGDSFSPCPKPHEVLAVPANAPWMKLAEAAEFMTNDSAKQVFPTHNTFMSDAGNDLANRLLAGKAEQTGKTYHALKPGESIEV